MVYYWKVQIPEIEKEVLVYAHNAKECDIIIKAWLERQRRPGLSYTKGNSYCIKKGTPTDIVEKELEHLGVKL